VGFRPERGAMSRPRRSSGTQDFSGGPQMGNDEGDRVGQTGVTRPPCGGIHEDNPQNSNGRPRAHLPGHRTSSINLKEPSQTIIVEKRQTTGGKTGMDAAMTRD